MKMKLLLLIIFTLMVMPTYADPGIADTVRIDSIATVPQGGVILPVYFYNDETLSAVEIVLTYDTNYIEVDTFSLAGTRLEYLGSGAGNIVFRDSLDKMHLWLADFDTFIPAGSGQMCKLEFTVKNAAVGETIVIDTTRWWPPLPVYTLFADSAATTGIKPQFVPGKITVLEPPPNFDSVWVDSVSGEAGALVEVPVNVYNEDNIEKINIPLSYDSDYLTYANTVYTGLRGQSSKTRVESVNNSLGQVLLTLTWNESTPLETGTGTLARVQFQINAGSEGELINIDTASYLGIQSLEFISSEPDTFTPYFNDSYVYVRTATDVGDEDDDFIIPDDFALNQNTPNPFNPTTDISFDLPRSTHVTLNVYNILGQKARTLIDENLPAGSHIITFDGRDDGGYELSSGIYFYQIKAGEFSQSRKMTLLK